MDFDLLTDVIEAYKQFQLSLPAGKKSSLVDFGVWVNTQDYSKGRSVDSGHAEIIGRDDIDAELGKLIIYLNRYARLIIKKGLADFPELISEDFTYLYILMTAESMTKIQLIEKNVHEKASGLEVIKRLLKHRLIAERDDENDKRSKRVFLTDKGRATFFSTLETMGKVSAIIAGKLTREEKSQLFTLLKKLEDFHNPIFLNGKLLGIDDLLTKVK
jgi:DNA-binding MarR family transcriptional regulator